MKITFSRELTLQKAEAYLEIEKKVIRKDIQDYLNGKHFKNPLIESRVKKYLQEIGVFNSASFLTRKGEEIKKTGETYEVEKGKYTIWYIENDFVLGTKILFFSRKDATTNPKKENIAPFSVDFTNEEHLLLPSLDGKTDFSKFKLRKQTFFAKIHSPDKLFFKWVWNGLDSSYYEFQGKLGYNEIKAMNIPCDKNLEYEIQKFKGWNVEQRRLTRNFDEHSEEEKKTFYSDLKLSHSSYAIALEQIPIMPENKEIAAIWRNWLLEQIVKEKHLTATEFEYESMCIQQKEGLAMYNLETPQVSNFIKERSENKLIKWHLQAPEDLNPNKEFFLSLSSKVIEIPENSTFSFEEFVTKLDVKTGDVIIYYDYYALKRPDLLEKLLNSFDIPKKVIISQPFSLEGIPDLFKKQNQTIYERCRNKFKIFALEEKDEKRLHDRYLIIRKEGKWHILNGSNSLNGYIGKEDKNKGLYTTKASVIYAYVKENMLTKNTINFLNKIANENK